MSDIRFDPLPQDPIKRARRLARDLAWGYLNDGWRIEFEVKKTSTGITVTNNGLYTLKNYVEIVWNDKLPDPEILVLLGYIRYVTQEGNIIFVYNLTEKAILLTEQAIPSSIFISYSRQVSSALALLLVARFKEHGLSPFLDMHPDRDGLTIGGDWHAELEQTIKERNDFIVLIGPNTLNSPYVRKEITWALDLGKRIKPVWHNQFNPKNSEHLPNDLSDEILQAIEKINAAIVEDENPKQYNAALDELLASFGILP